MEENSYWCIYKECVIQFNEDNKLIDAPIQEYLGDNSFILDTQCSPTPEFPKWIEQKFNPDYKLSLEEFTAKFAGYTEIDLIE